MEEINKRICKICREIKDRIQIGRYPNSKDKKYVDTTGKQWSGSTCPSCHTKLTKERTKNARKVKKTTPVL